MFWLPVMAINENEWQWFATANRNRVLNRVLQRIFGTKPNYVRFKCGSNADQKRSGLSRDLKFNEK